MLKDKKKSNNIVITIILCFLVIFCGLGMMQPRGLFVVPITEGLGISRSAYSVTDIIRSATTAVLSFFFGILIEKFGSKILICAGFAAFAFGALAFSFADNVVLLYVGSFLFGVGISWAGTAMVGRIISKVCNKHRGTVLGFVFAANGAGGAVFSLIIGELLKSEDPFGYRNAYYMMVGVFVFVFLLLLVFYRNPKSSVSVEKANGNKKHRGSWEGISFNQVKKTVCFYLICICVFVTGFSLQGLTSVRAAYMSDVGLKEFAATVTSVAAISLAVFKFVDGVIYQKLGLRVTVTISTLCSIAGIVILFFITGDTTGKVLAVTYAILLAIALPLETVMLPIYAGEFFGEKSFNKVIGVFVAMHSVGAMISSLAMNLCYDLTGSYTPAFIVLGILMTVMLITLHISISSARRLRLKTENIVSATDEQILD